MIYYYAVTKRTNVLGTVETANYGKAPSIGQALVTLKSAGFVSFFLEITEEDYNLLMDNLSKN